MVNERITEDIVREHFKKDVLYKSKNIIIEEQISKNPQIIKLLKNASKKGNGIGYPEFIISFVEEPNLIIVIECKANISKHESKNKDKFSEYAVDGALLYSSYLSKEFDVISIAVSGQTKSELKVTHFLQTQNSGAKMFLGDKLLGVDNYIKSYKISDSKFNQELGSLLEYSKELNSHLHQLKVQAPYRSLLISGILLALKNEPFKISFEKYTNANELSKNLVHTISNELIKGNIQKEKIDGLKRSYAFIKFLGAFEKDVNVLKNIIRDIDKHVNRFIKNHRYYDILGQFYIEFLRYANTDKGLGIVLTPPHITELFSDIAEVNTNSVIFDNCCGTGGFLISAMKKMVKNANEDKEKIKKIKTKQLVGIEFQPDIFALGCSNMFIHDDGKSGIYNGDCFDKSLQEKIKRKFKPTVGFLNPPYKSDKKKDTEEFEYILNNLKMIEQNGVCISIIPMSCALAKKGKMYELKERLLKNHTLEASFSMPSELFVNSKVNTVTVVLVFRAHVPHSKYQETFFGYWKEDGFVKNRALGRCDYNNTWLETKNRWLFDFKNKKTTKYTLSKKIKASDEWCIEKYMKIEHKNINERLFEEVLKEYSGYLFLNNLSDSVSKKPILNKKLELKNRQWDYFKISDYFDVFSGGDKPKPDDPKHNKGVLVNSIENLTTNNGIKEKISYNGKKKFRNFISVVSIGNGGHSFYQEEFGAIFTRVKALLPKKEVYFNKYVGLFLTTLLRLETKRYSYGRVLDNTRLDNTNIQLPIDKYGKPDWKFMENFIKSLFYSKSLNTDF